MDYGLVSHLDVTRMTNVTLNRVKDIFHTETDLLQLKTPNFNCLIK